jgi:hypothetical protein
MSTGGGGSIPPPPFLEDGMNARMLLLVTGIAMATAVFVAAFRLLGP